MTTWQLTREEWDEHRQLVRELHAAAVGTTTQPGFLERQRRQDERLDRAERRLGDHQQELDQLAGALHELREAPLRAASGELEELKHEGRTIRATLGKTLLDKLIGGLVAAVLAIAAVLGTAWAGLLEAVRHVPPTPPPHP